MVDAYAALHLSGSSKPIGAAFSLLGLYLHVERGYTGRQVQLEHMRLAQPQRIWPSFSLPRERGPLTCMDVLAKPEGPERDAAISAWCRSVWQAFAEAQPAVRSLVGDA